MERDIEKGLEIIKRMHSSIEKYMEDNDISKNEMSKKLGLLPYEFMFYMDELAKEEASLIFVLSVMEFEPKAIEEAMRK